MKELRNRIVRVPDNGDYRSDVVRASEGVSGEGE